jgi:hypothetical protein
MVAWTWERICLHEQYMRVWRFYDCVEKHNDCEGKLCALCIPCIAVIFAYYSINVRLEISVSI